MTIFGKSRDLKAKTPKTEAVGIFLRSNKYQREECIQMPKLKYAVFLNIPVTENIHDVTKLYDLISFICNAHYST